MNDTTSISQLIRYTHGSSIDFVRLPLLSLSFTVHYIRVALIPFTVSYRERYIITVLGCKRIYYCSPGVSYQNIAQTVYTRGIACSSIFIFNTPSLYCYNTE